MAGRGRLPATIVAAVLARLAEAPSRLLVLGLCGAQGSGKSTLAGELAERLDRAGIATGILSIDDLYRTRAEREALALAVHPLLRTRGVPGTHDVALGLSLLAALEAGHAVALPRFDKSRDDRAPAEKWPVAGADTRVLILEGWCVGARPQPEDRLATPVNALERDEDGDGRWRHHVNAALGGDYQRCSRESTCSSCSRPPASTRSFSGGASRRRNCAPAPGGAWTTPRWSASCATMSG